ncbi:MAG: DEAD/DEAH box helicase, partial [Glaciecola sp.]
PVVHIEHGVGRYLGLETLDAGGVTTEFVAIEYGKGAKLYVPVSSLHFISRYSGGDPDTAPLHLLGNDTWNKAKEKAAKKVRDVAAELLNVYAKRAAKPGFAHDIVWDDYKKFADSFPFPETPDQEQAINAVLNDMGMPSAMDRLVCGDVGFGKTEVAMRAAFIAANAGKQVSILVPTTLLAQQHFENFVDRFADWPFNIQVLSRFVSAKDQRAVLEGVKSGHVDIVVGTHKLIQNDVKFADLGLVIIDEEHRFGVRQKDKFKALRADVDILTLTATPIPRTLNMAMSGMRDLSIIATPPAKRLPIKTFVQKRNHETIREAVMREILRGGQVYFLHNDVATIENTMQELTDIIPEARIAIGHGQMRERELEQVMDDFYHQRYNVLLCTTIIETGIDVPSANTIIMDRADHLGLAQLHQLRGRVGRSHHQAYAYLLTPHPRRMTKDSIKRLEAIASLEDLGAGFALATHDLEIRGAGELLG